MSRMVFAFCLFLSGCQTCSTSVRVTIREDWGDVGIEFRDGVLTARGGIDQDQRILYK